MADSKHIKGDILIVDDNPANLQLLASILREQGHDIRAVVSGQMALMAAQAAPPDLVLLDIRMPDMDGYEVCQRLKADNDLRSIPVIFISSPDVTYDKVRAFEVGGVDYITKPFQVEEVIARVESQLSLHFIYQQAQKLAMLQERERLARDLHDAVSQTIFSISMISETLLYQSNIENPHVEQSVGQVHQLAKTALSELRILLLELRPETLLRSKLSDLLSQLANNLQVRSNIELDLQLSDTIQLPPAVHIAFYRIAQEALTNILKHAEASHLRIGLEEQDTKVCLTIADNGRGFCLDDVSSTSFGLNNMRERAAMISAKFTISSIQAQGTTLTLIWER